MSTAILQGKEKAFVFGGNATFTLRSGVTGRRYTYKVRKAKDREGLYFASLMTGRDNEADFTYMGILTRDGLIKTRASKYTKESLPVKALEFFMLHIENIPKKLEVFHEERCCCCGRKLTTPESIQRGIGPECLKLV